MTGLQGEYSEGGRAARCERWCVARGGVMCADGCAAGSYKGADVRGAKSSVGGMCVKGVGVAGGQGLKRPHGNQETVSEPSRANARTHLLTVILTTELPFTELLLCAAAPPPKLNPEQTLKADGTSTARTPGLHKPINFVTHLRARQKRTARKGGGKQRVLESEQETEIMGTR
jgi:hypothetical protein